MRQGLYIGWVGQGNLGDEAMLEACRRLLPRREWRPVPLRDAHCRVLLRGRARRLLRAAASRARGDVGLLGGGTLVNGGRPWLIRYRGLLRQTGRPVPVFATGVCDPAFCAGREDDRAEWVQALRALPAVGVRGPRSLRLLREAGLRNARVTGDPALALRNPDPAPEDAPERQIGFNVGTAQGQLWGREPEALAVLAEALRRLLRDGWQARLFPVSADDESVCRETAQAAGLPDSAVDPYCADPARFLAGLRRFQMIVSFKLHAAVLAAAAGVPFVAVEYQPKVRDFTDSLGGSAHVFRSDRLDAGSLVRSVRTLHDGLDSARDRLASRVAELRESLLAYAGEIEGMWR